MPPFVIRPRRVRRTATAALVALALGAATLLGGCENLALGDITPPLQDEAPLTRAVQAALEARPELSGLFISVKSLDADTVRLSGRVDTAAQRATAEQAAAAVDGVRSVVNTLYVRD